MPEINYRFRSTGADGVARDYDKIAAAKKRAGRGGIGGSYPAAGRGAAGGKSPEILAAEQEAKAAAAAAKIRQRIRDTTLAKEDRDRQAADKRQLRQAESQARSLERVQVQSMQRLQRARAQAEKEQMQRRQKTLDAVGSIAGTGLGMIAGGAIAAGGIGLAVTGAAVRNRAIADKQARALASAGRGAGEVGIDPRVLLGDALVPAALVLALEQAAASPPFWATLASPGIRPSVHPVWRGR